MSRNLAALGSVLISLAAEGARAQELEEVAGVRQVCSSGPAAAIAAAQKTRGEAGVLASRVLPNPSLRAEHQGTFGPSNGEETIFGVGISVGIGGRWFLLQDAARARRDRASAEAQATLFESAIAFRKAYVSAAIDQARVAVLAEQQTALDSLSGSVEKLARGGETAMYDLTRQQTQARLHRRILESARGKAARSLGLLEAWTGNTVALPRLELTALAGGPSVGTSAQKAEATIHPRVRSLEAEALANSYDATAARRRWVPDLDLFAGYRTSTVAPASTDHGFALGVGIPLTFFDHGQGEAARAEAEQEIARASAELVRRQIDSDRKAAARQLALLEAAQADLEKAASEALALQTKATRLYAAGEANITELIDAFRTAEEARLARVELALEIASTRLSVMEASGTMFDAGLDRDCGATVGARR